MAESSFAPGARVVVDAPGIAAPAQVVREHPSEPGTYELAYEQAEHAAALSVYMPATRLEPAREPAREPAPAAAPAAAPAPAPIIAPVVEPAPEAPEAPEMDESAHG